MTYPAIQNATFIPFVTPVQSIWLNGVNSLVNGFVPLEQSSTQQIYAQNGAKINRMNDRLFVGDATVYDGVYPTASPDWLSQLQANTFGVNSGSVPFAQFASLTNTSVSAGSGVTAGAQTKYFTATGAAAIGVQAFGYANNENGFAADCWGYYGEAHRLQTTDGNAYGIEIAVTNETGVPIFQTPYAGPVGLCTGIQIDSGNGFGVAQEPGLCAASSAMTIVQNTTDNSAPFLKGIIFSANSIQYNSGIAEAISFPEGYSLQWYGPGGGQTSSLLCTGTTQTNATQLDFQEGYLTILQQQNARPIASFAVTNNATNYLFFAGAVTGSPPVIAAGGNDTNINLYLEPKGTGVVQFGTYTAGSLSVTGYITIADSAGNTRRLLVG